METTSSSPGSSAPSPDDTAGSGAGGIQPGRPAPKRPNYERIAQILRGSILAGSVPAGMVLLEGPIAEMFGLSRSPVKQALAQLEAEGLVQRFEGRGVMVRGAERPLRLALAPQHLLAEDAPDDPLETLYYRVEREILQNSLFGRFRVNELALARHYDIGRANARELLLKAARSGLVVRRENAHWSTVPLDEKRLRDLYQLREVLEPIAIRSAVGHLPPPVLAGVAHRLQDAVARFPALSVAELDRLEQDIHETCLGFSDNPELLEALVRARASLVSGKHMQSILMGETGTDAFLDEHLAVVTALQDGHGPGAAEALLHHLVASREKNVRRLEDMHRRFAPVAVAYIVG